jgi:hypothetical protein
MRAVVGDGISPDEAEPTASVPTHYRAVWAVDAHLLARRQVRLRPIPVTDVISAVACQRSHVIRLS